MLSYACWLWNGPRNARGYGLTPAKHGSKLAHRLIYELLVGPVPPGMELDHLCRQRGCVNPNHLKVCTHFENATAPGSRIGRHNATKTHCPAGHEYLVDNSYIHKGKRNCRKCHSIKSLAAYHARRAAKCA